LHLEAETQRQAQELADMKLRCEAQRAIEQRTMEQANVEHQNRLAEMKHDETMRQQRVELEAELDAQRRRTELTVEERRSANAEQLNLWQQMRTMQVDLTRYFGGAVPEPRPADPHRRRRGQTHNCICTRIEEDAHERNKWALVSLPKGVSSAC